MEVELGFQANCSELVTHLGFTKREDIIKALADIAKLTGWSWWIEVFNQWLPVPTGKLDELVTVRDNDVGVGRATILSEWKDRLNEDTIAYIHRTAEFDELEGLHLVGDKESSNLPGDPFDSTLWAIVCDCEKPGFSIQLFQHFQIEEMPAFHSIRMAYDSDFRGHDGGSDMIYLMWLAYHFVDRNAVIALIKRTETFFESRETIKTLEKYPPLDNSSKLPEDDIKRVWEYLR
jgi:hypothetical protein